MADPGQLLAPETWEFARNLLNHRWVVWAAQAKEVFGGAASVAGLAAFAPRHLKQRVQARIREALPGRAHSTNHDLTRAFRRAWCDAAIVLLGEAERNIGGKADVSTEEALAVFDLGKEIRARLRRIRADAYNREAPLQESPIDRVAHLVVGNIAEYVAGDEEHDLGTNQTEEPPSTPGIGFPPSEDDLERGVGDHFIEIVAELIEDEAHDNAQPQFEVPEFIVELARDGWLEKSGRRRRLGQTVLENLAELLKGNDFPEAKVAFNIYLHEQTHLLLESLDVKVDRIEVTLEGLCRTTSDLRDAQREVVEFFRDSRDLELDDPSEAERLPGDTRLNARFAVDAFRERRGDLDFLEAFLGGLAASDPASRFRWALLTGPGGEGKTRLALEFLPMARGRLFGKAGFLKRGTLEALQPGRWKPTQPSLVVIDYPAEAPAAVRRLLVDLAERAGRPGGLPVPVRILLVEREAKGEWFKKVDTPDGDGALVRQFCFLNGSEFSRQIEPLSRDALLGIMLDRIGKDVPADPDELYDALCRVDTRRRQLGTAWLSSPRPFFAAAVGEAVGRLARERAGPTNVVATLSRRQVFEWLIEREREHFWPRGADHDRYENLLVVATACLGLPYEDFENDCPEDVRPFVPDPDAFDPEYYRRMVGGEPYVSLARLEPDPLGEYFVLSKLKRGAMPPRKRNSLLRAALRLGGDRAAVFLIRCGLDFPEEWRAAERLRP